MTKKSKTIEQGYFKLKKADKYLHFSMNAWVNLRRDADKNVTIVLSEWQGKDMFQQFDDLCDIVFAAMKAYDQEEGNDIDYNVFSVREWMEDVDEDTAAGLVESMMHSVNKPVGKKKAKK